MADHANLGGGDAVRVLGRTECPHMVYDDLHVLRAFPRVLAVVGRQVGGAGLANPPFGVTACQLTVQNHGGRGVLTDELRSAQLIAQLRERLALCRTDRYSPLPVTRHRRLRPGGVGDGQRFNHLARVGPLDDRIDEVELRSCGAPSKRDVDTVENALQTTRGRSSA
jgi:hypothetical protein